MMLLDEAQALALSGHRAESYRYAVLNFQDQEIGELDGVTSASFELSIFTTIRTGGSMECQAQDIDWLKVRIQPWYTMVSNGTEISWPIGVFIPAAPGTQYTSGGSQQTVELYDKLQLLEQDKMDGSYSVPAGTNVTNLIKTLLTGIGETRNAITDSTATLRNPMVFEADLSKLTIINELLKSINYFSLWVDGYGVFQGTPYIEPGRRGQAWQFADDYKAIYAPDFFNDRDDFHVPNKVTLVSTSDGETAALTATVLNEDPNSPYSINQRGTVIATTEMDIEASSQSVLNSLAQRRLIELSDVSSTYDISHALIPLELNDAVRFIRSTEGINVMAVVQKMSFSTEVGSQVKTTIRVVGL